MPSGEEITMEGEHNHGTIVTIITPTAHDSNDGDNREAKPRKI
jgi:hypothetical protein